jgi:tyrosine-protein kinase Etk/Wzc
MQDQDDDNIDGKAEEETNMLYYLVVILKRKKMIAGITLTCALIAMIISLIMTPIYKAETKILPPQGSTTGISSAMLGQVGVSASLTSGTSGLLSSSLGLTSPNDLYVGLLKSRTVYDGIIDKFGLMKLYKAKYRVDARKKLSGSVTIENGKDNIISVAVEDKDSQRAADIANAFIEKLKDMTQKLAVTEASKRRLFFEEQLKKAREDLLKSEMALQNLQEKTGALDMDAQTSAVIRSIADLRAQITAKEVELKVMKTYTEPKNPDLQKAQDALIGMQEELQKLEAKSGENPGILIPTGMMPGIGADYTRKLREVKYNETLADLMAKEYEIARVDEARDATMIQVVDTAVQDEREIKPKRTLMVVVATLLGFFLGIFTAFFNEFIADISCDEGNSKLIELIRKYSLFEWRSKSC